DFNLPILDLDYLTEQEQDIEIIKITDKLINKPFNLEKYPLFRIQALHLKSDSYILLFNIHHIIFDGWSFNLFFTELKALYTAYMSNLSYSLPTLSIQYSDFSLWQKKCLENKILEPQFNYWKQQLDGILPILELPQDYPRPKSTTYEGATESFVLSPQLTKKLSLLAQQEGVSLFMLLLAVFQVLLCRYTGQEDVIVGTPIAGRKYQEFESLIGMFVNTLVIRTDLSNNPSFRELLKRVKQICLEAYSNQDVPFERLVEVLNPQRNLIYTPLFQVMFVLQNAPLEEQQLPGLTLTPVKQSLTTSKFDLTLFIKEENGQLIGEWEYKTNLFKSATIKRMIGHFQMLLSGISSNIEQTIWQLPLLTEPEEHQLLKKWNHTESNYPQTKSIHRLFEEQVNNNPNAIALVFEEQKITYQELNNKANQLAHYLRKLGVKIEQYIGLYLPPSLIRIVTLLAILKAGAVYVPLDPAYPQERVKFMIEDSGISILLSEQSLSSNLSLESLKIINLDTTWEDIERESMNNLENNITGKNLAYLIYTSGSTGQPKGVSILHQGVVRLVKNTNYITINSQDIFLQLASLSFDAATFEIWGCLLNGAKLIIFPLLLPTLDKIEKMIKENNISVLWLTSGLFNLIVDEKLEALQAVRYLLTGGDTLSVYHVKKFIESNVNCQLINGYGPTENTTFTCCHTIQEVTKSTKSIPIGRPIANTKVYILDTYLNPVPIGVRGELYIGGDGLAREYLNRPELTAKRFIASPFDSQERLYKTGDYARYLPDKNIEFLGRIDKQVKIRGFRVELGEIETALREYSDIRDAVVMTHRLSDQDKLLTAYIITENRELNKIKIQEYLKRKLPIYMIPSAFIFLDNFPLTRNKKIDYQSLPLPNFKASPNTKLHQKPEGQIESRLITIWKQTLRISFVNLEDNFFDIGGSSLVAMRLLSKIQQEFKININLSTFLQNPTIQYMTVLIREGKNITSESSLVPIKSQGSKPPLFFINSISQARKLGDYLDINQPFYVLNVFGITEFLKPQISSLSLEKIATKFIEDIENVQPTGPYYLVTYCADSFLTFEIAQQLKAKGKEIALLVFIDSIWKTEQFDLYWYWYNWQQFGLDYLRESLKNKLFYTQEKLRINLQQLQGKLLMNNKITLSRTLEDVRLLKAFEQAREEYSPQRYEGKVTLFLSKQYSLFYPSKIASLVTEGVEINEIPGYHSSLFKEPYIISLAKKLQTYL
nr:amino acid adenylation domain-containing protein [Crocosphaera sp.]